MMKLKKLLFLVPLFTLFSCGDSSDEAYQINEEQFNVQKDKDYILTQANYTIKATLEGEYEDIRYYDCGKNSHGRTKYKLDLIDNIYRFSYYSDDGEVFEQYKSKEDTYRYFFDEFFVLFDIDYRDISFNSTTKRYDVDTSIFDVKYNLSKFSFSVLDGYIRDVECFANSKRFTVEFLNIGTTNVKLIDVETRDYNLIYQCEPVNGKDDSYIVEYATECLRLMDTNIKSVNYSEGTLEIIIHEATTTKKLPYIEFFLKKKVNEEIVLTNAHDTEVHNIKSDYYMDPNFMTLAITARTEDVAPLLTELISDIQNNNTEYALKDEFEEEESSNYSYPLFIWKDFDEDLCTFEGFKDYEEETLKLLLSYVTYNLDNLQDEDYPIYEEIGEETTVYLDFGYPDYNGDGLLNEDEILTAQRIVGYLSNYINLVNEGFHLFENVY